MAFMERLKRHCNNQLLALLPEVELRQFALKQRLAHARSQFTASMGIEIG
jgi:hypothetical protein